MKNIAVILALLLLPYGALLPAHVRESVRGRIGVALVFTFTAAGHFIKTSAMTEMLPRWVPLRVPLIYVTGVFELLGAIAILVLALSRGMGVGLCVLLLVFRPANIFG